VPANGAGLLLTQVQPSPPSLAGLAPAGSASSTQTLLAPPPLVAPPLAVLA
jgi:hypothetical protein